MRPWIAAMFAVDEAERRGDAGAALLLMEERPLSPDGLAVAWSDGSHLPLRGSSVTLCESGVQFAYATDDPPWAIRKTDSYTSCTSRGEPGARPTPSAGGLAIAGTPVGEGHYLVAYADRLVAYRVG
jgi:hypothetical protein